MNGMQAADFSLIYDNKKLEYIGSDLDDVFINNDNNKVFICWFSVDDTDKTKVEFEFKAKKTGEIVLKTEIRDGFSTGELKQPKEYNEGSKTIEVLGKSKISLPIGIVLVILFLILIINKKIKGGKRK